MTRDDLIEVMARALYECDPAADVTGAIVPWAEYSKYNYYDKASDLKEDVAAALLALEAAGARMVPVEPSRHMLVAAHMVERDDIELTQGEHRAMYAAMLSASPFSPPAKDSEREGGK